MRRTMQRKQANPRVPARRRLVAAALCGAASLGAPLRMARAAERVTVWSTTDRPIVQPLLDDFERRHGGITVDYVVLGSL